MVNRHPSYRQRRNRRRRRYYGRGIYQKLMNFAQMSGLANKPIFQKVNNFLQKHKIVSRVLPYFGDRGKALGEAAATFGYGRIRGRGTPYGRVNAVPSKTSSAAPRF